MSCLGNDVQIITFKVSSYFIIFVRKLLHNMFNDAMANKSCFSDEATTLSQYKF